jgi:hypothetical protein
LAGIVDAASRSRLSWHAGGVAVAKNSLRRPELVEAQIEDENGKLVGTVRVKPTAIMWARTDAKKWRRVNLAKFIEWMEVEGELGEK